MIPNSCYIVGAGASIRQSSWDISPYCLPLWRLLKNKFVITLNWSYKFVEPTIALYVDYKFFITEQPEFSNNNIIIGYNDSYYVREKVNLSDNVFLLNNSSDYINDTNWKKGFYSTQLSGLLALSVAIRLGVKNIYLLGYDATEIEGFTHFYQDDGKTGHIIWNNSHITGIGKDKNTYKTSTYDKDINRWFNPFICELGKTNIINVSQDSKINTFQKINYKEFYSILLNDKNINQKETQGYLKKLFKEKLCR